MLVKSIITTYQEIISEKNNYILATITTSSSLLSSVLAYHLFDGNINVITWAFIFGIFLPFYCFGKTKKEQLNTY